MRDEFEEALELAREATRAHTRAIHALVGDLDYPEEERAQTGRYLTEQLQELNKLEAAKPDTGGHDHWHIATVGQPEAEPSGKALIAASTAYWADSDRGFNTCLAAALRAAYRIDCSVPPTGEQIEAMARVLYVQRELNPHIDTHGLSEDDCHFLARSLWETILRPRAGTRNPGEGS